MNIEFVVNGQSHGYYGANVDASSPLISGGVYNETIESVARINSNPGAHTATAISVGESAWFNAWNHATNMASETANGQGNYILVCGNCVDFARSTLDAAALGAWAVLDYLQPGTIRSAYAHTSQFLCLNPYSSLMDSQFTFEISDVPTLQWVAQNVFQMSPNYWQQYYPTYGWLDALHLQETILGRSNICTPEFAAFEAEYNATGSPIAIDLNGDGIRTIGMELSTVTFDLTGDGVAERTGWLNANDGFLVWDRNGNGIIDGVGEMFGGMNLGEGYAKLALLDSNGDGIVDASDELFSSLSIWQDADENGVTGAAELKNLHELGLTELSLDVTRGLRKDNGNFVLESSSAVMNGQTTEMADVYFRYTSSSDSAVGNVSSDDVQTQVDLLVAAVAAFGTDASSDAAGSVSATPSIVDPLLYGVAA